MDQHAEQFVFEAAKREQLKARIGIVGPSGAGKTYSGLVFAKVLAEREGGQIFVIDTENRSAAYYADEFDFQHLALGPPYSPVRYRAAMDAAVKAGASVILIDSGSHAWAGEGGVLEFKDELAKRRNSNSFDAWREATPEHNRFVDALIYCPVHVIMTMRSKVVYTVDKDEEGRVTVRKVGMQPIQREGMDYEFTVVMDADLENTLVVSKSRSKPLAKAVVRNPGKNPEPTFALANQFADWLQLGVTQKSLIPDWLDELAERYGEPEVIDFGQTFAPDGVTINYLRDLAQMPPDAQAAFAQLLEKKYGAAAQAPPESVEGAVSPSWGEAATAADDGNVVERARQIVGTPDEAEGSGTAPVPGSDPDASDPDSRIALITALDEIVGPKAGSKKQAVARAVSVAAKHGFEITVGSYDTLEQLPLEILAALIEDIQERPLGAKGNTESEGALV